MGVADNSSKPGSRFVRCAELTALCTAEGCCNHRRSLCLLARLVHAALAAANMRPAALPPTPPWPTLCLPPIPSLLWLFLILCLLPRTLPSAASGAPL